MSQSTLLTAGWSIGWCAVDLLQHGSIDYPRAIASALGAGIVGMFMVMRKKRGEELAGSILFSFEMSEGAESPGEIECPVNCQKN